MIHKSLKHSKRRKKDSFDTKIRKKLGVTQEQLASVLHISRSYLAHVESGKRNLASVHGLMLANMFSQFEDLEAGSQISYRSPETKLFLNAEYKKILPNMEALERDFRLKIKHLRKELAEMKERASNAEHAIIVFSTVIKDLEEKASADEKTARMITGFDLFKQQAYDNLLTCWEPEQAKLHGKIEAIAGEAKALRRYRVKVMREQELKLKRVKKN